MSKKQPASEMSDDILNSLYHFTDEIINRFHQKDERQEEEFPVNTD